MTWLALRLLLGGWASKVWAFLCHRSFWQLVCMGCAVLIVVQHFELVHARSEAGRWHKQFDAEHAGRASDRTAYVKAQTDAAAANKLQVAAKEAQSRKVSDDERQAYLRDLAQLRADDQRLRSKAAQRPAGPANPSAPPAPAAGADGDELHLSPSEHLQAAEIELRLMHLQNYVDQQLAIDPNKP